MNEQCYKVYPSAKVAAAMDNPACVTTDPRYNLARTEAILRFQVEMPGCINRAEAIELTRGPAWQEEEA